jgi:ABC-2 type transport system ATP-binding protein
MWNVVRTLRESGVTIILTTHYIEEAEEMADRVGVINKGKMILVEDKATLMQKLGQKKLTIDLVSPLTVIPSALERFKLALSADGKCLTYVYDTKSGSATVAELLAAVASQRIDYIDLHTEQSSLEEIFMGLVNQ